MVKIYDTASNAFIEEVPKIYDQTSEAWIEAPSLKTFDETESAWLERLYQGYFTLRENYPVLMYDDEFIVTSNEITLFTAKSTNYRHVIFELPIKWNGETIKFDLVKNAIATVSVGIRFKYGQWTNSGQFQPFSGVYDGEYFLTLGTCPDEYDGQTVTDPKISIEIYISAENAGNDIGYVSIKNLKFNGKKYGFKE